MKYVIVRRTPLSTDDLDTYYSSIDATDRVAKLLDALSHTDVVSIETVGTPVQEFMVKTKDPNDWVQIFIEIRE